MPENSGFLTTLETDENDNLILDFPNELLELLDWEKGDLLSIDTFAGRIIFSKVEDQGVRGGTEAD
jgi:hypothetical protein